MQLVFRHAESMLFTAHTVFLVVIMSVAFAAPIELALGPVALVAAAILAPSIVALAVSAHLAGVPHKK